jgi:hypothetical protein
MSSPGGSGGGSIEENLENTDRYKRNLRKYARNRGLTRAEQNSIFKETRRLGQQAKNIRRKHKRAPQPKPLTQGQISAWGSYREYIHSLPLYYISCHGGTCASYAQCGAPELDTTPLTYPFLTLPEHTFMINIVNGEICQMNNFTERLLMNNEPHFKNALLVDSPNDSTRWYDPSFEYPILSGIQRSSPRSLYPNYICIFDKATKPVRMGVFNLSVRDEYDRATLVYFPTDEEQKKPIFIGDVIRNVIASSGPGIFILGACSSMYETNLSSIPSSEYATGLVRTNELEYTSIHPTLSISQITSFDPTFYIRDPGSLLPVGLPDPALMANLAGAVGEVPSTIFPPGEREQNLVDESENLFKEFKKDPTFRRTKHPKNPNHPKSKNKTRRKGRKSHKLT